MGCAPTQLPIVDVYSLYRRLLDKFVDDRRKAIAEYERSLPAVGVDGIPCPPWPGDSRKPVEPPVVEKYFSMPFIGTGGVATLNALQELDLPTLELLAAFNHANQVRLQKLRFNRQVNTSIAALAAFAGVLTSHWVHQEAQSLWVVFLSRSVLGLFFVVTGATALALLTKTAFEQFFYLRPRIARVDEFGHLLDFTVTRARILHQHKS